MPTENGIPLFTLLIFYSCMDIHLKKLGEIKRASTVKRNNEDAKKLEEYLNRRNQDKVRTNEFEKQGKQIDVKKGGIERDMGINRGNKKLLEKLVEISKGKHVRT